MASQRMTAVDKEEALLKYVHDSYIKTVPYDAFINDLIVKEIVSKKFISEHKANAKPKLVIFNVKKPVKPLVAFYNEHKEELIIKYKDTYSKKEISDKKKTFYDQLSQESRDAYEDNFKQQMQLFIEDQKDNNPILNQGWEINPNTGDLRQVGGKKASVKKVSEKAKAKTTPASVSDSELTPVPVSGAKVSDQVPVDQNPDSESDSDSDNEVVNSKNSKNSKPKANVNEDTDLNDDDLTIPTKIKVTKNTVRVGKTKA